MFQAKVEWKKPAEETSKIIDLYMKKIENIKWENFH